MKAPSLLVNKNSATTGKSTTSDNKDGSAIEEEGADGEAEGSAQEEPSDADQEMQDASEERDSSEEPASAALEHSSASQNRKRKRGPADGDLEDSYMNRIAKEEEKEKEKRRAEKAKRQKVEEQEDGDDQSSENSDESDESKDSGDSDEYEDETSDEEDGAQRPMHESMSENKEVEKSNRTVFLGNVSNDAIKSKSAKKTLLRHLGSFLGTLPENTGPHKVESIRFRSTAYTTGNRIPKRAAYAHREVMDETTPSTNAYAVYSTTQAARKAPNALNGTVVLDRHLRVDSVAHPSATDHKRCVFVGNLDFVDKEAESDDEDSDKKKKKKKRSQPADVEEGLWRTFNDRTSGSQDEKNPKQSKVESVRVIRDRATRVGKGFAYVQFYDQTCVEEALLLDGQKFPPMLPRKLRVTRARKMKKRDDGPGRGGAGAGEKSTTLQGRASKLFGRAGASKLKTGEMGKPVIFEGTRATEDGSSKIKVKTKSRGSKGKSGKPKTRSSRRGAAYKASGGKKT